MLTDTLRYDTGEVENGLNKESLYEIYCIAISAHLACGYAHFQQMSKLANHTDCLCLQIYLSK
jgi:hypothetical protein